MFLLVSLEIHCDSCGGPLICPDQPVPLTCLVMLQLVHEEYKTCSPLTDCCAKVKVSLEIPLNSYKIIKLKWALNYFIYQGDNTFMNV